MTTPANPRDRETTEDRTMATHMLSEIENWRRNGAAIPRGYELRAAVEAVMDGWDGEMVAATAADGVADADLENAAEIVERHDLDLSLDDVEAAILAECRRRMV